MRGVGFWRAESVPMIHRLNELRQPSGKKDTWLWELWLDPADYSVPGIQPWILQRLDHALKAIKAIGDDPDEIERYVDSTLRHPRLISKLRRRGISSSQLRDLLLWAYRVAADTQQQERLDNPDSHIFPTLRQVGGIPERGFPAPDRELGVELMSVQWFREVTEQANPDALEQVRRDCRAIDRLATLAANVNWRAAEPIIQSAVQSVIGNRPRDPPSVRARKEMRKRPPIPVIVRSLLDTWDDFDFRASVIPVLISIRQLPEHSKRLTEILGLATWCLELASRYSQSLKT
jgi:hypothetical protein